MTKTPFEREILALRRQGIKYDLDRMHAIVDRLGHPERRYLTLHVAGTNGKGSTAAMLATGLASAGYRVGLNTSPHLVSFRERIRVDGRAVSETDLFGSLDRIRHVLEETDASFFECATALAFTAFADQSVDVAVFEVGLGGRLDATNVIRPVGGVITRIDLEHTRILGATREAIAREKAGIAKGQPLAVAGDDAGVLAAIETVARVVGSEVLPVRRGREWTFDGDRLRFPTRGTTFRPALVGEHQAENAALALTLLERLERTGALRAPASARRAAVEQVTWPGRFDVREVSGTPVVFDVAHNAGGGRALAAAVRARFAGRRVALVVGMLRDKDHPPFLRAIADLSRAVIACTPGHEERKMEAGVLARLLEGVGVAADVVADPAEAVRAAIPRADVVVVTGSLFTVGEAMAGLGFVPADEPLGLRTSPAGESV